MMDADLAVDLAASSDAHRLRSCYVTLLGQDADTYVDDNTTVRARARS
jgi:hypothetical protein